LSTRSSVDAPSAEHACFLGHAAVGATDCLLDASKRSGVSKSPSSAADYFSVGTIPARRVIAAGLLLCG
jgi:hypothetical protein